MENAFSQLQTSVDALQAEQAKQRRMIEALYN